MSGNTHTVQPVHIFVNRKLFAAATVFVSVIGVGATVRELAAGSIGVTIIIVVLFGRAVTYYARGLARRSPAISIDATGLAGFRVRGSIRWAAISDIYVSQHQGVFGVNHDLVAVVRLDDEAPISDSRGLLTSRVATETIKFSIDQLARPWNEVIGLIEKRVGRDIPVRKTSGFRTAAANRR